MTLTQQQIQFLFTLRYNPFQRVNFKPRPVSDFIPQPLSEGGMDNMEFYALMSQVSIGKALEKQIGDKKKIAISFSAGVDSNVVYKLVQKHFPDLEVWVLCMDGAEVDEAEKLSQHEYGRSNFIVVEPENVFENLHKYSGLTTEPRWNVYHHKIAKTAKELGCDLLLTGDGADEIFLGYTHRYEKFLQNLPHLGFFTSVISGHGNDYLEEQKKFLKNFNLDDIFMYLHQFDSRFLEPLERFTYADFNGKLIYDFIPTSQAISSVYGIDIKSPFLDKRVIDFGLSIPLNLRYDGKTGKLPLRGILNNMGVKVPDGKRGFTHDLVSDYNAHRGSTYEFHPRTFDYINYDWFEQNSKEDTDYTVINKLAQTYMLSEYLKRQ